MKVLDVLRREIYAGLDHDRVFRTAPEGHPIAKDPSTCPLCGTAGSFETLANRAHGYCNASCGRLSWWGHGRRVLRLDPTANLLDLAKKARVHLPSQGPFRLEEVERLDRQADLLEEVYQTCLREVEARRSKILSQEELQQLGIGLSPGVRALKKRLRQMGLKDISTGTLFEQSLPAGSLLAPARSLQGEIFGFFVWTDSSGTLEERFVLPYPPASPPVPFRFNEVVGSPRILLTESAWECCLLVLAGHAAATAFIPCVDEREQIEAVTSFRTRALYFEPAEDDAERRIVWTRETGSATPFVLANSLEEYRNEGASLPPKDLFEGATPGTEWSTLRSLSAFDPAEESSRHLAIARVHELWEDCPSPVERSHMIKAASEFLGLSPKDVIDEFRARHERSRRQCLRQYYLELFQEGNSLLGEGRFVELEKFLFQKNTEIAEWSAIDQLQPFEPAEYARGVVSMPDELKTGYPELERYVRILPGEIVVFAARPSHGKSSLAVNLLLNMLRFNALFQKENPYIFFSFELNREYLTAKLLSALSGRYNFHEVLEYLRSGLKTNPLLETALAQLETYAPYFYLVGHAGFTAEDIVQFSRRVHHKHGRLGAILVDYLQIVGSRVDHPDREERVLHVMRQLRIAAENFRCPVLAMAQCNRPQAGDTTTRPGIGDIVEGRVIEQEGNTVLALFNEEVQKAQMSTLLTLVDKDIVPLEVIVRKNKFGSLNQSVTLDFRMRTNEIRNRGQFIHVLEIEA